MAVSGKFIADFESFYSAVQKAEVSLRSFEGGAGKVESSLNRVTNSLSGTRIIQEATIAAEAVQRIGGVSKLTEAELARVSATASEAAAKLRAMGQGVPENIDRLAASTRKTGDAMSGAAKSIREVDGVLGAAGVSTGPLVKVFEDLGGASGKTAAELGKVGTAGLALGAGIAGWQLGRAISEFFNLDQAIGNATAKLLGFGDVAAQEAGAGADVLARASKNAGRSITDMAEAMRINQAAAEAAIARNKQTSDAFVEQQKKAKDALDASAAAAKRWSETLDAAFRKWSGRDTAEQAKILDITFRRMADSGKITEQQLRAMAAEAAKLAEQGAILSPRLWDIVLATGELDPKLISDAEAFARVGAQIDLAIPKLSAFNQAVVDLNAATVTGFAGLADIGVKVSPGLEGVIQKTKAESDAIAELARGFSQLSQIAGGSLGAIVRDFGTLVAATDTAKKSIDGIKSGFSKGGFSGILDATTGILGLTSAAISAGKAIASLFDRNKGRDLVEDFAKSFGGFDALQKKMQTELGAGWEKYWISLTQGVGRNNPEQARRAIEEVTRAFEEQKTKAAEAADASARAAETQAKAQQDALDAITGKYADTISKLDSEWKRLNDSVSQEAEEAVMGVVETQQRERMRQIEAEKAAQEAMRDAEIAAKKLTFESWVKDGKVAYDQLVETFGKTIEIPYKFVPQGGGPDGGGATYAPPAGAGRGGAGNLVVPVYLNEREVGRGMARVLPGVLTGNGR